MPEHPVAARAASNVRLLVRVCAPSSGDPLDGIRVTIIAVSPNGVASNPLYLMSRWGGTTDYGTELLVKTPGSWKYEVQVEGPQGKANFEVPLEVGESESYGGILPTMVFLLVGVVIVGGAVYLASRSRPLTESNR